MSGSPSVSVLMTVYNAEPWLREAIDSVIAQSFENWELITIQNGSTDASPAILASYADPRIRVISVAENMGRTLALRHAFDLARGEYVAVLDADDVAAPARLARQVEFLDRHESVVLVGAWTKRIDGAGRELGAWTPPTEEAELRDRLGYDNPIVHSAAMYRAGAAREVGGYPAEYPYAQDCGLWIRLAERGAVAMIGEFLASHRTLPGSMTRSRESQVMVSADSLALLEEAARRLPLSKVARGRNREEHAIAACRYAVSLWRAKRARAGVGVLLATLRHEPGFLLWNRVCRAAVGR